MRQYKRGLFPKLLFMRRLTMTIAAISLANCHDAQEVLTQEYFESNYVRYSVDGFYYDVPVGYLWFESIKAGRWGSVTRDRIDTTILAIEARLPNFSPYSIDDAKYFDGRLGHGEIARIRLESRDLAKYPFAQIFERWKSSGELVTSLESSDKLGLQFYKRFRRPETYLEIYTRPESEIANMDFWIECHPEGSVPSPSCTLYDYRGTGVHAIESVFAYQYLPMWRDIRENSSQLMKSFAVE